MNDAEKLALFKVLAGVDGSMYDSAMSVYLKLAGEKITRKAFPFDSPQTEVPARYSVLQCEIATYLWNKRGAEGETSHDENGVKRTYESASVPDSMLKEVVPYCYVPNKRGVQS